MISVVIPSYNRRDGVLALLGDVFRQEGCECEVIVVDDCSTDGSFEAVAEAYPDVVLLRNEVNSGPCVTRNRGILAAKGGIIAGFDSDVTLPDRRLFAKIEQAFAARPQAAGFAFRIFKADGATDDVERWWHKVPADRFAAREFETCYFSGTGYAFRAVPLLAAGLYPEVLYMHYEEVELAWRILDASGTIIHRPDLSVVHHAQPTPRRSRIRTFYKPRNQILLACKSLPFPENVAFVVPRVIWNAVQSLAGGYFATFLESMKSALSILRSGRLGRSPLKRATIVRIRSLSRAEPLSADAAPSVNGA